MSIDDSQRSAEPLPRCPHCDSVVQPGDIRCLMCGRPLASAQPEPGGRALFPPGKRPSTRAILTGAIALITLILGGYGFFNPEQMPLVLRPSPTPAAAAAAAVLTPTATPSPTTTPTPTSEADPPTPTSTATPLPTSTPRPPRLHRVESGQTLVGLAQLYGITLDSIISENRFANDSFLFAEQEVLIPWPTPTPPLQAIAFTIGEETIVIDPANCPPFYEIQEGDSLFFLAAQNDVPLDALLEINFLTVDSILRPGDIICIPNVIEGGFLPPTPGPSPTPSPTAAPQGPRLLFPPDGALLATADRPLALQWLAVKDLAPDEWYMVELLDLTDLEAYPLRGFTRATSFQLPDRWAPQADHTYQWRISIVRVTGRRTDGSFIYTFGGSASQPRAFTWPGS